jgi:hypothetical protein
MQALPLIRQLRFKLQMEMLALPGCRELQNTEVALSIYEQIVIQKGLEGKEVGRNVEAAFDRLIAVAREAFLERRASAAAPLARPPARRATAA